MLSCNVEYPHIIKVFEALLNLDKKIYRFFNSYLTLLVNISNTLHNFLLT